MLNLELKRISSTEHSTLGVLFISSTPIVLTLERPWQDNQPNISCIPAGTYLCKRTISPTFGETFEITNVPNRTHILFHKGNFVEDSKGCIIIGSRFGIYKDSSYLKESRLAFEIFMQLLKSENEFYLNIKETC